LVITVDPNVPIEDVAGTVKDLIATIELDDIEARVAELERVSEASKERFCHPTSTQLS
jgi:hypothetical protein